LWNLLLGLMRWNEPFTPILIGMGVMLVIGWAGTYTTLGEGSLTTRRFFWARSVRVDEIRRVVPHPNSGRRGYGMCLIVITESGRFLTLQPNHPVPFLSLLRKVAPAAEFQV
jgi:hypothetical protein